MRKDVKIGIALGAFILLIAVYYYDAKRPGVIELADQSTLVHSDNREVLDSLFSASELPGTLDTDSQQSVASVTPPQDSDVPSQHDPISDKPQMEDAGPVSTAVQTTSLPLELPLESETLSQPAEDSMVTVTQVNPPKSLPERSVEVGTRAEDVPAQLGRTRTVASDPPGSEPKISQVHVIVPGDTFAGLAQKYYGSSRHTTRLVEANQSIDPRRMKVGDKILIPALGERDLRLAPQTTERHESSDVETYTVRDGDTFYDIALRLTGSGAKWAELYERNRELIGADPNKLKVGQVLALPATW